MKSLSLYVPQQHGVFPIVTDEIGRKNPNNKIDCACEIDVLQSDLRNLFHLDWFMHDPAWVQGRDQMILIKREMWKKIQFSEISD